MHQSRIAYLLLALAVSGCTSIMNGAEQATTISERHPITVDQQTVSVAIAVDPARTGLTREDLGELDRLVTAYRTRGYGPVTITAPRSRSDDLTSEKTAAEVRAALTAYGLSTGDMRMAAYDGRGQRGAVLVSFTRFQASGPVCGIASGEREARLRNLASPNFGCTDQHNLAAMVADPRDLARMQAPSPSNGAAAAAAVRTLNTGQSNWGVANSRAQSSQQ